MTNRDIVQEFKQRLLAEFSDEIVSVIVFGSVARGEDKSDSDIDVMVVFREGVDASSRWSKVCSISSDVSFDYDTLIGSLVTSEREMATHISPLYVNIRKEGIRV